MAYLAAYDVHRGKVFGRGANTTIAAFTNLVTQVMTREPYASADRVFWIVDNGSSHRGQAAIDRLAEQYPNADESVINSRRATRSLALSPLATAWISYTVALMKGRYMVRDCVRSSAGVPADGGADTLPARELSADFYRVLAVVIVVIGHWLVSAVTFRDGRFGNDYPLAVLPWTQWLTLVFQVVPVFFLVGGYASAASWTRWLEAGGRQWPDWLRHRLRAILGPTTVYVVVALAMVAVLGRVGVGHSPLSFGGWAIAMHLWFVPVYLVVVALTPVAVAAHRRWGLMVPAVLALAVIGVDAAARSFPGVGWANYLLCWGAVYQIGICWRAGALRGYRPVLLATAAVIVLAMLLVLRWYPISMVGAPGAPAQNNFPPTVALLAFATAQTGLLVVAAPAATRWLRRSRWPRLLAGANKNVMALYLWQMVPVVVVALVGYPTGLLPQPAPGTGPWFLFRLVWLVILSVVTAATLMLLWLARSVCNRPLPTIAIPLPVWSTAALLVVGVGIATLTLSRFSIEGFAPDGRFPTLAALLYAAAVGLVSLTPCRPCDHTISAEANAGRDRRRTTNCDPDATTAP